MVRINKNKLITGGYRLKELKDFVTKLSAENAELRKENKMLIAKLKRIKTITKSSDERKKSVKKWG